MAKYRCDSPECANKPAFEGPKGLNRCLHCGAADPKPMRSFTRPLVSSLLLLGLAALVWYFPKDLISLDSEVPPETSGDSTVVISCDIVGFANTSTDNCLLQFKPLYGGACTGDEIITFRTDFDSAWSALNAGSSINMVGRTSVLIEFKMDDKLVQDTTIIGTCSRLSPADIEKRRDEIVQSIKDFLEDPISGKRYTAHENTKQVPSGKVILPDGTTSSGMRWQMDVYMLWPEENLSVEVELDDYGRIQLIKLT